MNPSMDCSTNEESIDGVISSIRALFNDSEEGVLATYTGFWPTVDRGVATLSPSGGGEYARLQLSLSLYSTIQRHVKQDYLWVDGITWKLHAPLDKDDKLTQATTLLPAPRLGPRARRGAGR